MSVILPYPNKIYVPYTIVPFSVWTNSICRALVFAVFARHRHEAQEGSQVLMWLTPYNEPSTDYKMLCVTSYKRSYDPVSEPYDEPSTDYTMSAMAEGGLADAL